MKLIRLVLTTMMLLILITVSCGSPTATPTGTVNAYLNAMSSQNTQVVVSYQTEDYNHETSTERVEKLEMIFDDTKSYSITNRNIVLESEDETDAKVSCTYDISLTFTDDSTWEYPIEMDFHLTQVSGQWLLSASTETITRERNREKAEVVNALANMMTENQIGRIPNPVDPIPTNDMTAFPDVASTGIYKEIDRTTTAYTFPGDKIGYVLYQQDDTADGGATILSNYIPDDLAQTTYFYTIDADGTVRQWLDANKTGGELVD
ncbi:MAG: hypothetical protein HN929_01100 [Chloroflexi bacterium]|nr:hypothetical protein [Chloroflexota bacterium]MBT7080061.1 hypothetical protein [Chloroflexota bacterium]MBT7289776.1 hypothetical protein [Chloroflexota bacterium]